MFVIASDTRLFSNFCGELMLVLVMVAWHCCYVKTDVLPRGEALFGFCRKRKRPQGTARTFVEDTGGGWGDSPDAVAADGGEHADYVGEMLR